MDSWFIRLSRLLKKRPLLAPESRQRKDRSSKRSTQDLHTQETSPTDSHIFTLARLNIEAAHRQAKIGQHYAKNTHTTQRLDELRSGVVTLPPHRPWQGDYTDWEADPFNDLNWRFQFHTLRWINPLLWDALDGDRESKNEWKRIVKSWADANTPPERATDKYAWMDMTDGNRAIQLSIGAPLADEKDQWYIDLLIEHRNWLLDDSKIVPGNHGLHQNVGLFVIAAVLNDKIGIDRAVHRLGQQVLEAFEKEGLNEEGSVAYHQSNVSWWKDTQSRLALEGRSLPPEAAQRLNKAGETMAYLLLPDGTIPQIGDGGRGRGRANLHPLIKKVLQGDTRGQGLATVKHYNFGFTIFRSGWGETQPADQESHTIVRHGKDLKRHSHNDRGSIHLYTKGTRWLTDGGFHSYQQRNRHRNYTKSRRAHNLINIPAIPYDKTGNVPVELLEQENDLYAIQILDENFETASWRRRVIYLVELDMWIVWDRVRAQEPTDILQQWLVDVGIKVRSKSSSEIILEGPKSDQLHLSWLADEPIIDVAEGDRSSGSARGLIGIGWKKMRDGTSVHAEFYNDCVDSIVIIHSHDIQQLSTDLLSHEPMTSFIVRIETPEIIRTLEVQPQLTRFVD